MLTPSIRDASIEDEQIAEAMRAELRTTLRDTTTHGRVVDVAVLVRHGGRLFLGVHELRVAFGVIEFGMFMLAQLLDVAAATAVERHLRAALNEERRRVAKAN